MATAWTPPGERRRLRRLSLLGGLCYKAGLLWAAVCLFGATVQGVRQFMLGSDGSWGPVLPWVWLVLLGVCLAALGGSLREKYECR